MAKAPIETFSRSKISLGNGATSKEIFPKGLSAERYVIIKIYDTSEGDPNVELAKTAGAAVGLTKAAFGSVQSSFASSTGVISTGTDVIESVFKSVPETFGVIQDIGNSAYGSAKNALNTYLKDFKDLGNPELKPKWKDNIYLPLPNDLNEMVSHQYGEQVGFAQGAPIIGAKLSAAGESITNVSNLISKGTGTQALSYNSNKLVNFEASLFRELTLVWQLIPNNAEESLAIQKIITKLKAYSSPQAVAGKMLLRAPFFCRLEFPNKIINNALQFKEVVIVSIEVNYSTSGNMETFITDNMPKTMSLTVTFKDREPKTLQSWAEGQPGYGDPSKSDVDSAKLPPNGINKTEEDFDTFFENNRNHDRTQVSTLMPQPEVVQRTPEKLPPTGTWTLKDQLDF